MNAMPAPKLFRVESEEDLERIPFTNGMAAVEVPAHLLDKLDLKNEERGDSLRLRELESSIRSKGFQPAEPIKARIGRKGRWIVVNGGHRITAARHVMKEFWANLFGKKVNNFYFILFTNPDSWKKVGRPEGLKKDKVTPEELQASRQAWERSDLRRNAEN